MNASVKLSVLLAALVAACAAGPASAADACKNVKFLVTNNHFEGREIRIEQVKYYNPHAGKEQTEDVKNLVCKYGATCTTGGDNLANAEKVDLRDIKIVFAYREHDGQWSKDFVTQPYAPKYPKCDDNSKYGPVVVKDHG